MFRTLESFRYPLQFGGGSTLWRAMEFALNHPRVLVTIEDQEADRRTFLLGDAYDLQEFGRTLDGDRLVEVGLILPSDWSPSKQWALLPIERVRFDRMNEGGVPSAAVKTVAGQWYGGHPLEPIRLNDSECDTVL